MVENIGNEVAKQLNIDKNTGTINFSKQSRLSKRFERLKDEVQNDRRYYDVLDDLKWYLTPKEGIDMPQKLKDGGFNEDEIFEASKKKEFFWKKSEKFKFYEAAQRIDLDILANIKTNFDTYIKPLINQNENKDIVMRHIIERVVNPILLLLNEEGADDDILDYNSENILGMIYHLTGNCHLYWKNYDNI